MENNSIREFTCDECYEVSKVDWSQVRPDIDDGTSNIEIHVKDNGYAYYGGCMNCGNLVEIEPPVPDLVADNVDIDKDGMFIQITDKITNRSCWIEAWQDKDGEWLYEFNTVRFNLDDDKEIIDMMFQNELKDYPDEVYECIMEAIEDNEEEYNKLQENKAPTMRDRLKEAKAGTVSIKAYGKIYYEFSEDEWNSMSEEDKEATIVDTADQATDEEGHTVYEDEVEVITESKEVKTEAKVNKLDEFIDEMEYNYNIQMKRENDPLVAIGYVIERLEGISIDNTENDFDRNVIRKYLDELENEKETIINVLIKNGEDTEKWYDVGIDIGDIIKRVKALRKSNTNNLGNKEVKTETLHADQKEKLADGTTRIKLVDDGHEQWFIVKAVKDNGVIDYDYDHNAEQSDEDRDYFDSSVDVNDVEEILLKTIKENKTIKTEDTTSSEFNLYIKPEELSDVNISSLLFDSDTVIADYKEGNYMLSLIVRGDIRILDNEADAVYKNYQQFPKDLKQLIKSGELGYQDSNDRYVVDMSNWFEWFLDKDGDNVWYDVADIEGMLNKTTLEENKTELEVIMKDLFDDIVGQLNEGKKVEAKSKDRPVKVLCYGKVKEYPTRQEAIKEFLSGMYCSEGSERERYTNIYLNLVHTDKDFVYDFEDDYEDYISKHPEIKKEAKFKDKVKAIKKSLKKNDKRLSDKTAEKSAEKIAGSMIKKENVEMNNAGKINNSLDRNKIAKFLEKAITDLTTTDYTCIWYDLDGDLALFVGWTEGYDTNDETVIHSKDDPSYVIASKIASNHEFMKTDLDWLIQPYGENGDVWDTQMALSPNEDFINTAEWYIGEYKKIRDAIDKGELLLENKKVTESKTSDMDQVDIVMELEGGEITIEDVADWNKVKSVADSLKGSQGFYVRLLASMLDAEEEFGGVENLPFPITM